MNFKHYYQENKWKELSLLRWCDGFFLGSLCLIYKNKNQDKKLSKKIKEEFEMLNSVDFSRWVLDVGFVFYFGVRNYYEIFKKEPAKEKIKAACEYLLSFYDKKDKLLKGSWDFITKDEDLVCVDILMNALLLLYGYKLFDKENYKQIAKEHIKKSLSLLLRGDGSVAQFVGLRTKKEYFFQGIEGGCWARGFGWALYACLEAYKYLKDAKLKDYAYKLIFFLQRNLPKDYVLYFDFFANTYKDTSANAIAAAALTKLKDKKDLEKKLILALRKYTNPLLSSCCFIGPAGILADSTLIFANYFLLEALSNSLYEESHKELFWILSSGLTYQENT